MHSPNTVVARLYKLCSVFHMWIVTRASANITRHNTSVYHNPRSFMEITTSRKPQCYLTHSNAYELTIKNSYSICTLPFHRTIIMTPIIIVGYLHPPSLAKLSHCQNVLYNVPHSIPHVVCIMVKWFTAS